MATIPVAPRVLRNYLLRVDADNFEAAVESVLFAPSSSPQTWTGASGITYSDVGPADWTVTIGYMQDWTTAGSLGEYLLQNEGKQVTIEFSPNGQGAGTTDPVFTATVTLVPGSVGGTNGRWPTTTAAMPCSKPVLTRS